MCIVSAFLLKRILNWMLIYKIINKINGLSYVGQTINSLKKRWKEHCYTCSNKTYIDRAINKHGEDMFEIQILRYANTITELNELEEKLIIKNNCMFPNGYNLKEGGNNKRLCDYVKEKMRKAHISRIYKPLSKEHKEKISKGMMGKNTWMKGKKHSELSKLKMSLSQRGTKIGKDNPMFGKTGANKGKKFSKEYRIKLAVAHGSKPFYLMDLQQNIIKEYEIMSECARENNLCRTCISNCLNGIRKKHKNYTFKYV